MSDTDPYAAPTVEEARFVVSEAPAPVEAPVKETPVVEESAETVPDGTIKEVLAWVGTDPVRAKKALDQEEATQNRTTLINKLTEIAE